MKTYKEAVAYILSIPRFAKKIGIENLSAILDAFGHPERAVPAIHVAGTNGKGSTCAFLQSVYMQAGLRVGMFTSPHLVKINERIRVNGKCISDDAFTLLFQRVQEKLEQREKELPYPSFFEMLFLMAAVYFSEQQVDLAIYETGMGGRLDATNVLAPSIAVITSVGLDHTEYLGDTIEQIAYEKAGIIKENTPVATFFRDEKSAAIIKKTAKSLHAPLYAVEKKDYMIDKINTKTIDFSIDSEYYKCGVVSIPRTGLYQVENAALAMLTVSKLPLWQPDEAEIRAGLMHTVWEGRMEQVLPHVYLDGAHNEEAVLMWRQTLDSLFSGRKKRLLFAVANNKDYQGMIRHICRDMHYEKIYITSIPGERRTELSKVAAQFAACTEDETEEITDTRTAFFKAAGERSPGEDLFLTGSLYLVGAVKEYIEDIQS